MKQVVTDAVVAVVVVVVCGGASLVAVMINDLEPAATLVYILLLHPLSTFKLIEIDKNFSFNLLGNVYFLALISN